MVGLMPMLRKQMNEREERERSGRLGDIEERVTTPWWATMLAIRLQDWRVSRGQLKQ